MNTQQQQQTLEQMYSEIATWEQLHKPANLAESFHNRDLISNYLAQQHGGEITVKTLNLAIRILRPQLEWLADEAPVAKHANDVFNTLANLGIQKSPYMSQSEREERQSAIDKQYSDRRNETEIIQQRRQLREELRKAEMVSVQIKSGPFVGRCDHSKTADVQKEAVNKIRPLIEAFNRQHPEHRIELGREK